MKERIQAQQAYKDAMDSMKMPAQIDLDKRIITSGSGSVRIKSKWLGFAAAAVMLVFVAVGVVMIVKGNEPKTYSATMQLEKDSTIPSGEIKSVEQAVEECRKCTLLRNDEYIKLQKNKDNLTKEVVESFESRYKQIDERDSECRNYLSKNADYSKPLFFGATLNADGYAVIGFHCPESDGIKSYLQAKNNYYLCDAKTGKEITKCIVYDKLGFFGEQVLMFDGALAFKLEKFDVDALSGNLMLISKSPDDELDEFTLVENFKFCDKLFMSGKDIQELDELVFKAKNDFCDPITINIQDLTCAPHGIYMRVFLTANNEKGDKLIKSNIGAAIDNFVIGGDGKDGQINIMSDGWLCSREGVYVRELFRAESASVYDCYIPLAITPQSGVEFKLNVFKPNLSQSDIVNGDWNGILLGSTTVTYEPESEEKVFYNNAGNEIRLSDMYFTLDKSVDDVTLLTLKYEDGNEKTLPYLQDIIWESCTTSGEIDVNGTVIRDHLWFRQNMNIENENEKYSKLYVPNFFKEQIDTSGVTSIVYAGEEYTLRQ